MLAVSLALLLLKNQGAISSAAQMGQRATAPGIVDVAKMQTSVADLAREVVTCYHRTARFNSVELGPSPWDRQSQYGADNSGLLRIRYSGVTGMHHEMIVAVMTKENQVRTAVLRDTDRVPYAKGCQLEDWTGS
jgi:hypothetical protein